MKKVLLVCLTISTLLSINANANIKIGFGIDQGFGVTAQYNNIKAFLGNDGVSADYIFNRGSFGNDVPFSWYIAGGTFIGWNKGFGLRLPLGLDMAFNSRWDAYVQVHPELDFDSGHDSSTKFSIDASIGVRYRF